MNQKKNEDKAYRRKRRQMSRHGNPITYAEQYPYPWNKGLTMADDERLKEQSKRLKETGTWNKGLKKQNDKRIKKIALASSGKKNHWFGTHGPNYGNTGKKSFMYGKRRPINVREKISRSLVGRFTGRNSPNFGRVPSHGKSEYVKTLGHYVRSTWERNICLLLKNNKITYRYEPEVFDLGCFSYCPDIICKNKIVIEVKGYFRRNTDIEKLRLFKKQFPGYRLILITSKSILKNNERGLEFIDHLVKYDDFLGYTKNDLKKMLRW